jgi:pyridoxamine 5'-phosphate oxidase family protein
MTFSESELAYLRSQRLGRLATEHPNGTLQVSPVGFRLDELNGTIDIAGFFMSTSQKYRNVAHNAKVAFVVDDVPSVDPWRVRCLEIRGTAEVIAPTHPARPGDDDALIRIHPSRVLSFGLDGVTDPHEMLEKMRGVN